MVRFFAEITLDHDSVHFNLRIYLFPSLSTLSTHRTDHDMQSPSITQHHRRHLLTRHDDVLVL